MHDARIYFIRLCVLITLCSCNTVLFGFAYDRAIFAAQQGKIDDAQEGLHALLVDDSQNPTLLYDAGLVAMAQNKYEDACALFCTAAYNALNEKHLQEQALYNAAGSSVALENLEKAISLYEEVLHINPENEYARHNLTIVKNMQQQKENNENSGDQESDSNQQNSPGNTGNQGQSEQNTGDEENEENNEQNQDQQDENSQESSNEDSSNNQGDQESNQDQSNQQNSQQQEQESDADLDSNKDQSSQNNEQNNNERGDEEPENAADKGGQESQKDEEGDQKDNGTEQGQEKGDHGTSQKNKNGENFDESKIENTQEDEKSKGNDFVARYMDAQDELDQNLHKQILARKIESMNPSGKSKGGW